MKEVKKYLLPGLLMIWPYMLLVFNNIKSGILLRIMMDFYFVSTLFVIIGNMIYAFRYKSDNTFYELSLINLLLKVVHIPFYLCVFVMGVLLLISFVVPALMFVTPILIIYLMIIDLFLMITSSMYGVNAIIKGIKNNTITMKQGIINLILHFVFVGDVLSAIYLFKINNRKKDNNN